MARNNRIINAILLTIYNGIVWAIYLYQNIASSYILITIVIGISIVAFCLFEYLLKRIDKFNIVGDSGKKTKELRVFVIISLVCLLYLMTWFIAHYPGYYSTDSMNQLSQALNHKYSDWHPAWHTLLFFTFPLSVTGSIPSIGISHILFYSAALGYSALTVYRLAGVKATGMMTAFVLLNPFTIYICLHPWKDLAFSSAGMLLTAIVINFIIEEEKFCENWINTMLVGLVIVSTMLFRHNGILFVFPLLISLAINIDKKKTIRLLLSTIAILLVIKIGVYSAIGVSAPDKRVIETAGIPLNIISNVAKENPSAMDEELEGFVYSIASKEIWEQYQCGNFNSIKWKNGVDLSAVEELGSKEMVRLMIKCFRRSPRASFRALFALTETVYGVERNISENITIGYTPDDMGTSFKGVKWLRTLFISYYLFITSTLFRYPFSIGIVLLVVITVMLGKLEWKSWASWKRVFIGFSILAYDYGTMLLLTGPDGRFFYITFVVSPMIIMFILNGGKKNERKQ